MSDDTEKREKELIRKEIVGSDVTWRRLRVQLFGLIETILGTAKAPLAAVQGAVDVAHITVDWGKAKVVRASLENQRIQAEIAEKYADAALKMAQAQKESRALGLEVGVNAPREILAVQNDIKKILDKLGEKGVSIAFHQEGNDGHIFIGKPNEIGEPTEQTKE